MVLYKPPTRVTTIQIPIRALIDKADPDRERMKHREPEFFEWSHGKVFQYDPYNSGAYAIPVKKVSVNYSGGTFNAGDLTGVGQDFVYVTSTNVNPGTITTRTAAQMLADISGASAPLDYNLRIINLGEGSDLIIAPGQGVGIAGQTHVPNNTYSDIQVSFTDAADLIMTVWTANNPYKGSALVVPLFS